MKRVVSQVVMIFAVVLILAGCQLLSKKEDISVEAPYIVEAPDAPATSQKKKCVMVLGAGLSYEVFYVAGWLSTQLQGPQALPISQWVGSGFGTYILMLLSQSVRPNWVEYQLSKLSDLDSIFSDRDSWFFKSKLHSFLYTHFSALDQTLKSQAFSQGVGRSKNAFIDAYVLVVEKFNSEGTVNEKVLTVPVERISVKSLPSWIFHPAMEVFSPDPIVPSLYETHRKGPSLSNISWVPVSSDLDLTSVVSDDGSWHILYFPTWDVPQHPLYSDRVLTMLERGRKAFVSAYRHNTLSQLVGSVSSEDAHFRSHRKLFLKGMADAKNLDPMVCR